MVKLSRFYAVVAATALVVLALPATRAALLWTPRTLTNDLAELLAARPGQPAALAAQLGEAWAYAAAAELAPLGSDAQARLFEQAAALAPGDADLRLRQVELLLGPALRGHNTASPWAAAQARQALQAMPEPGAYGRLLQAALEADELDWAAVSASLEAAGQAPLRLSDAAASRRVERLLRAMGVAELDAAMWSWIGLRDPAHEAIRELADATAARAAGLAKTGHEAEAVALLSALAKAGERLWQGDTSLNTALLGINVQTTAFGAGQPVVPPPPELRRPERGPWVLHERVESFAARLDRLGRADDAAWVRAQPATWQRIQAGVEAGFAHGAGDGWHGLLGWALLGCFFLAAAATVAVAELLCGVTLRRAAWLPWRGRELAAMTAATLLVALPPAAVMGARLLHILTHGPMRTAALALAQLLATTLLVPLVVAVACWWLGFRYARRTGARGPWGRLRAAGHFSSRAVAVPALAIQAILLTLALLCAGPLAWHRHQMAFAIGESWVDQSRAIADALASQPTATTIGR